MKPTMRAQATSWISAGLAMMVVLATTRPALGAEPRYEPVAVQTNFEGQDPERTARLQASLEKRAVEVLEHQHDVEVSAPDEAAATIMIYVRDLEERPSKKLTVVDYGVRVEVQIDGNNVGDKIVPCMAKGEAELVDCAVEGLPAVLEYLPTREAPTPPPDTEPADPPTPAEPGDETGSPDGARRRDPPLTGLGIAGAVIGAGGLATAIAGGVYLGRGRVEAGPNGSSRNDFIDYRPPGRVLLGVGVGALVTGAIMLAADAAVQAKKRRASAHFRLDRAPGYVGARVIGRF